MYSYTQYIYIYIRYIYIYIYIYIGQSRAAGAGAGPPAAGEHAAAAEHGQVLEGSARVPSFESTVAKS